MASATASRSARALASTTRRRGVLAASLAFLAFLAIMAIFVYEGFSLYAKTRDYAAQDLAARAELAALSLEEPLRTQDFRSLRAFDDGCREKGIRLTVLNQSGGTFFGAGTPRPRAELSADAACGECRIRLAIDSRRIRLPFLGALALAGLAFLVGIAGMLFFFYAFYRQRLKLAEMSRLQAERYAFVTKFTHELKTPLTGIIAAADLMEGSRLAEMIKSSAHRLDQLAQDLIFVYWGKNDSR